jgi:hypothetical protein|tara:strand:+ start:139 stop:267 length:129 start_codon:yes stop_codon:yes gene_type:complete
MTSNIYREKNAKSWSVRWRDNQGSRKSKNFSDKKYGTRPDGK